MESFVFDCSENSIFWFLENNAENQIEFPILRLSACRGWTSRHRGRDLEIILIALFCSSLLAFATLLFSGTQKRKKD